MIKKIYFLFDKKKKLKYIIFINYKKKIKLYILIN